MTHLVRAGQFERARDGKGKTQEHMEGRLHCPARRIRDPNFGERMGRSALVGPFGSCRWSMRDLSVNPGGLFQRGHNQLGHDARSCKVTIYLRG
jgi:hypothetical protein